MYNEQTPLILSDIEKLYYYGAEKALSEISELKTLKKTTQPSNSNTNQKTGTTIDNNGVQTGGTISGNNSEESPNEQIEHNNQIRYTTSDGNIINPYAMAVCGVTSVNLFGANLLTNIYENGVGIMTFDGEVTNIGESTFYNNKTLKTIELPTSIETIGINAFRQSTLESLLMPEQSKLKTLLPSVFVNCNNLSYVKLTSAEVIDRDVFYGCNNLLTIDLPNNVHTFGQSAFEGCVNLTTLIVRAIVAPSLSNSVYGVFGSMGSKSKNKGNNKLYIYKNATGYYDGQWSSHVLNNEQCGFHIEYLS